MQLWSRSGLLTGDSETVCGMGGATFGYAEWLGRVHGVSKKKLPANRFEPYA